MLRDKVRKLSSKQTEFISDCLNVGNGDEEIKCCLKKRGLCHGTKNGKIKWGTKIPNRKKTKKIFNKTDIREWFRIKTVQMEKKLASKGIQPSKNDFFCASCKMFLGRVNKK